MKQFLSTLALLTVMGLSSSAALAESQLESSSGWRDFGRAIGVGIGRGIAAGAGGYRPAYHGGCTVELVTAHGRVLDVFRSRGYDHRYACREALRQCDYELYHRQRTGRNPYARCEVRY